MILSHACFWSLLAPRWRRWKLGYANLKRTIERDFVFLKIYFRIRKLSLFRFTQ